MKYNTSMASILAEMSKMRKEQEGETPDPIDQAKKQIDKIKKLAVLKKQMQDIQKSENSEIDEGKMKQFHMMMKQRKTPEQIAKALKLDLKTVKALMKEAVDPQDTGGAEEIDMIMNQVQGMRHFLDGIERMAKDDGDIEEWVQNKITKAHDYLKTAYAYKTGEEQKESIDLEEKVEYIEYKFRNAKQAVDAVRFVQAMNINVPRNLDINSDGENRGIIVFDAGKEDFTRVHKMIMKKFRPQILAVEKLDKEDEPTVKKVVKMLKKASDAHAGQAKDLEKDLKDETDLEEFTDKQIERLRKEYESLRGKETGIDPAKFRKLRGMMKRFPKANLLKLVKADIPVLTTGAKAALVMYHGMKWKQLPEEFVPYLELFAEEVNEQSKFKSVDPKVYARIAKMMRGSKEEKQGLANMLNYFMPPEVVDMVRDKFGIKMPRGKIKFTDL